MGHAAPKKELLLITKSNKANYHGTCCTKKELLLITKSICI